MREKVVIFQEKTGIYSFSPFTECSLYLHGPKKSLTKGTEDGTTFLQFELVRVFAKVLGYRVTHRLQFLEVSLHFF